METKEVVLKFLKKILHLKIKFIKSPMFIGLCVSILISMLTTLYVVSKLTEGRTALLAARFLKIHTAMELQHYKKFTWQLFPYPKLIWEGIKLENSTQDGYANIDKIIISVVASDLINRKINVRDVVIDGFNVKINKSAESVFNFYYKLIIGDINSTKVDIYTNKNNVSTQQDMYLSEGFNINPERVKMSNVNLSYVNEQEKTNYSFYNLNFIITRHEPDIKLSESSDFFIYGNFIAGDIEYFLNIYYNINIFEDKGTISFKGMHIKVDGVIDQDIQSEIFGDVDYDYRDNFIQSNSKISIKGVQKLAKVFELEIPEKINNSELNSIVLTNDFMIKDDLCKIDSFILELKEFLVTGSIYHDQKNKKFEIDLSSSDVSLDDLYNISNISFDSPETHLPIKDTSFQSYIEKSQEILKSIGFDNVSIMYMPEKIEWNANVLTAPKIIFNKNKDLYNITCESDLNDGKANFSIEFKYPASPMEVKVDSGLVAFRFDSICTNVELCKESRGELDLISKFVITSDSKEDVKMIGDADAHIENLLVQGIDIGYAYDKFFSGLIEANIEPSSELLTTNIEKISANVELNGNKIKFINLLGATNSHKIEGKAFLNITNMNTVIYLEIVPSNYYYYQKFGLEGEEFYGIKLPIECIFKDGKWNYSVFQKKLRDTLEKREVDRRLYKQLLNLDLKN